MEIMYILSRVKTQSFNEHNVDLNPIWVNPCFGMDVDPSFKTGQTKTLFYLFICLKKNKYSNF